MPYPRWLFHRFVASLLFCLGVAAMPNVVTWPIPLTEQEFRRYTLTVEDQAVPVWSARVREEIHKPKGAGWTNMLNGRTEWCGFARFDFSGTVALAITVADDFKHAEILPRSAGVVPEISGRTIRFRLSQPRALTLVLDGSDREPLHLFTHRPETDVPSPDDPNVIYFGPGEHWVHNLALKSGQTLYLHGAAIVRATLPAGIQGKQGGVLNLYSYPPPVVGVTDATNVTIRGRGILDGTLLPHPARNLLRVSGSRQVRIEGLLLRNSPNWHLPIVASEEVLVEGLNGLSGRLNSDGINCVSSQRVTVRDCFIRGHDDSFVVKTTIPERPASEILYERCIAWNDWGYAFGVSYETRAPISQVVFRDCEAIFARHWALGVHVADSATVSDLLVERLTVAYPMDSSVREMGRALVKIDNQKDVWGKDAGVGRVQGITIRDLQAYGHNIPKIMLHGNDAEHLIGDVAFTGLTVNGEAISSPAHPFIKANAHVTGLTVAPGRVAAPPLASFSVVGDWQVKVALTSTDGSRRDATLTVPPPPLQTVTAERHERLPDFEPKGALWRRGLVPLSLRAQECAAKDSLEPASLEVRDGAGALLVAGQDYEADLVWGTLGRLPTGRLAADAPISLSYRYGAMRLDAVLASATGELVLRAGEPHLARPQPPELAAGETLLGHLLVRGRATRLSGDDCFPILETAFPVDQAAGPSVAERVLPKTLAKLRAGQPLRILAWGDSVTDASYLPERARDRWQTQFVARLQARFPVAKIELVTEAWGGRNTSSYLAEPPGAEHNYQEKVLATRPDLVVSEFVNDAGLSPAQVAERYGKLLADFTAIGAEWAILTPHYTRPDWMGLSSQRDCDEDPRGYVHGLRQFTATQPVALADAARRWGRLWRQGLPYNTLHYNSINHPDARGMALFAESLLGLFPEK